MSIERDKGPHQFSLEEVIHIAQTTMLEQGAHVPTVIAEGDLKSAVTTLSEFPDTHEEKVRQMLTVGFSFGQRGDLGELNQVFFITEAWLSIGGEGRPPQRQPSKDPDRKEVLIIGHLAIKESQSGLAILGVSRDDEGRVAEITKFDIPGKGTGHFESPLLDAFVYGFRQGTRQRLN